MSALAGALIATSAGVLGALITGYFTHRRERNQQLHDRMLEAADDFALSVSAAISGLFDAMSETDRRAANPTREDLAEAQGKVHEAAGRLARVEFLFGPHERPAEAARDAVAVLHEVKRRLYHRVAPEFAIGPTPTPDELASEALDRKLTSLEQELMPRFSDETWTALRGLGQSRTLAAVLGRRAG